MNIKPTENHVLLKPIKGAVKTKSGIYITPKKVRTQKARVIAMGKPKKGYILNFKVGDVVIHSMWKKQDFKYNNEEFIFVKYENILAKEG